jgi:arsenical pump membrane protein
LGQRVLEASQAYPKTTAVLGRGARARVAATVGLAAVSAVLFCLGPGVASAAVGQSWPPFALVTGLLLIGRVAEDDRVFAAAGARIARLPGGRGALLAGLLGLVAAVTVVLNLDTAVVFVTPVVIHAARNRGADERPFVYGSVFMSNSASLLLPGSNLTNLLVLNGAHASGLDFARLMLAPWLAAIVATWLVFWVVQRRGRHVPAPRRVDGICLRGRIGAAAITGAAAIVLVAANPAIPVLALGVGVTAWRIASHRAEVGALPQAAPLALVGLFAMAVAAGTVARMWITPAILGGVAGRPASVLVGALAAITINNLPASVLLSAHPSAHPLFVLLGLNLGPNLFVTGSLSALLWLRVARRSGAAVSVATYARLGLVVGSLPLVAATVALTLVSPSV